MLLREQLSLEQKRRLQEEERCRQEQLLRARQEALHRSEERLKMQQMYQMLLHKNIELFWKTEGLYKYDPDGRISSIELYHIYKQWCITKHIPVKPYREFCLYTKKHAPEHCITYTQNIPGKEENIFGDFGVFVR